eukprot:gene8597-422_t
MKTVSVPHKCSDGEKTSIQTEFSEEDLKYELEPSYRGVNKILFLNPKNTKFYQRKPKNPISKVWLIRMTEEFNYVTRRLIEEAYKMDIELEHLLIPKFNLIYNEKGERKLYYDGKLIQKSEFPHSCLPRIGATVNYNTLMILKEIESLGVKMVNNVQSLENSRDKLLSIQNFVKHGLSIPKSMLINTPIDSRVIQEEFKSFPVILKQTSGSQGTGVIKAFDEENLKDLASMLGDSHPMIIQEYIKNSSGKDIRVIVVGDEILGAMMRVSNKGFKSNFHQGGSVKFIDIDDEMKNIALKACKSVGLKMAGVDLLIDSNGYKICEINSSPGYEGFELATGINVSNRILKYAISE